MDEVTKVILESIQKDVREIKIHLIGDGDKTGLLIEVDRLKSWRTSTNKLLWTVFTVILGTIATVLGAMWYDHV